MIKSNRFDCQHFHFPGVLIFMLYQLLSLIGPKLPLYSPSFQTAKWMLLIPFRNGAPRFSWQVDWWFVFYHNSKAPDFLFYIPTCQSERYFPEGSISVPARRGKAWQRGSLLANIYLQEGDHMGWGVCHHPHRFRLLNLKCPMRSSFSKTAQESPSLYKHFHLHDSFIQPLLLICVCGDWHPDYRIFIESIYRVKACVRIHFDQLSS